LFQVERREWLVNSARQNGRVDVNASAEQLGVTVETIRRDLNNLELKNLLRRVHGGAIPIEGLGYESNLEVRKQNFLEEKRRISEAAISKIGDAESVFWDEGFMFEMAAEMWQPQHRVTIVTNALRTAYIFSQKKNVEIIFLGGKIRQQTIATADQWGPKQLEKLVIDVALIGSNGISIKNGCTTPSETVSATKNAAIKSAHKSILLALSNRWGFDSFVKFADIKDFSEAISDKDMETQTYRQFTAAGLAITLT
jgi:DeoR family transcriptional regulator, fructose operon transcriptional repressor